MTESLVIVKYPASASISKTRQIWQAVASTSSFSGPVEWNCLSNDLRMEGRGSIPGSAGRFRVRISGAHALRLISRAGKEGLTVSSIICDRWLIMS